jgi:hypothetical protein
MKRKGTAATKAKNKYNAENYDRLYPYVKKGRKAVYEEAAKAAGVSLNDYITIAIEEKVARDRLKEENKTGHGR